MADRTPRTTETREKTERKKGWSRPSALPAPNQGMDYISVGFAPQLWVTAIILMFRLASVKAIRLLNQKTFLS